MESGGTTELNRLKVPSLQHSEREVKKNKKQPRHTKNLFPNVFFFCFASKKSKKKNKRKKTAVASGG